MNATDYTHCSRCGRFLCAHRRLSRHKHHVSHATCARCDNKARHERADTIAHWPNIPQWQKGIFQRERSRKDD